MGDRGARRVARATKVERAHVYIARARAAHENNAQASGSRGEDLHVRVLGGADQRWRLQLSLGWG